MWLYSYLPARRILEPIPLNNNAKDPKKIICPYSVARVNTLPAHITIKISFKNMSEISGSIIEIIRVNSMECIAALFALPLSSAPIQRAISDVVPVPKPDPKPRIIINNGKMNPKAANALKPSPATHILSIIR